MTLYFCLILVMTLLGAFASLLLKKATGARGIRALLKSLNLYLGGLLYFIAALLNIYVLQFLDYSVVLPLTAITYVWTMVLSHVALNERINRKKIEGIILIIIGVICISL